jgi:hypothetical protein
MIVRASAAVCYFRTVVYQPDKERGVALWEKFKASTSGSNVAIKPILRPRSVY